MLWLQEIETFGSLCSFYSSISIKNIYLVINVTRRISQFCVPLHLKLTRSAFWIDSQWCHWIFSDMFPSDCTMALGSTQPLVKMSTRKIPECKNGRCVSWKPLHLHVPNVIKIWETKPPETLWATPGLLRDTYIFTFFSFCIFLQRVWVVL
jgi:hypothetical protein